MLALGEEGREHLLHAPQIGELGAQHREFRACEPAGAFVIGAVVELQQLGDLVEEKPSSCARRMKRMRSTCEAS